MNIEKLVAWIEALADQIETNALALIPKDAAPNLRLAASMLHIGRKTAEADAKRAVQSADLRALLMDEDLGVRITVSPTARFVVTLSRIDSGFTVGTAVANDFDEALRLAMADKNRGRGQY